MRIGNPVCRSDARQRPAIQHLPGEPAIVPAGYAPEVANDKTMSGVEQGERSVVRARQEDPNFFKTRCVINGFAESISSSELQPVRKALSKDTCNEL